MAARVVLAHSPDALPTESAFRAEAERRLRAANLTAPPMTFEWAWTSEPFRGVDGEWWRNGTVTVLAEGYKPTRFHASTSTEGTWTIR